MLKIKFSFLVLALAFYSFSSSADAFTSADAWQVLCGATYVVTATVSSASHSEPLPYVKNQTSPYPTGQVSVEVNKVLSGRDYPGLGIAPGKKLFLQVGSVEQERLYVSSDKERARRIAMHNRHNETIVWSDVIGTPFVFLLFISPGEVTDRDGTVVPALVANHLFRAEVWADGEEDERMIYAVSDGDKFAAPAVKQDYRFCEARFLDPCTDGKGAKSVDELYSTMISPDVSGFTLQCSRNILATKGQSAVPALIKLLGSDDIDIQEAAASAIEKIGPPASATLLSLMRVIEKDASNNLDAHPMIYQALGALGENAKSAIPRLIEISRAEKGKFGVEKSLKMLAQYDQEIVIPYFASQLRDPATRRQAADNLGWIGKPARAAFPDLVNELGENLSREELWQFAHAIASVEESEKSVPALLRMLTNPQASEFAAERLGSMGNQADRAIPTLLRALHDDKIDARVRISYADALIKIGVRSTLIIDFLMEQLVLQNHDLAAKVLLELDPLPARYAPNLQLAITKFPGDELICHSLTHTHSGDGNISCNGTGVEIVYPKLDPATCKQPRQTDRISPRVLNYCACRPQYPLAAARTEESGSLSIQFDIDADSKLIYEKLIDSSHVKSLDKATLNAMSACKFAAGISHGKSVRASFIQKYTWKLDYVDKSRYAQHVSLDVE